MSRSTPPSDHTNLGHGNYPQAINEPPHCFLQTTGLESSGVEEEGDTLSLNCEAEVVEISTRSFDIGDDSSGLFVPERKSLPRAVYKGPRSSGQFKEWVPLMLRKRSAIIFAFFLWTYAIALQAVDLKIRGIQGISSGNRGAANALRYIPTMTAILLGFGWKILVSDLKKITPWAAMSNTWIPAEQSLLLNYIDPIDLQSVCVAARFKHWPLFLALLGGLLSGALVPLANALSYTDLRASASRKVTLQQWTAFDTNGTLTMPPGYKSLLPQIAFLNDFRAMPALGDFNNNFSPWTYGNYVFESFEHPEYGIGTTLQTEAMAFTSSLSCERLNYTGVYDNDGPNSTVTIQADRSSSSNAGCSADVVQMVKQGYNTSTVASFFAGREGAKYIAESVVPPTAWLNVTKCHQSDEYRILATVMALDLSVTGSATTISPIDVAVSAVGLICEPQYYLVPATLKINATTARVIDFNTTENKKTPVNISTSTLIMQAQVEGPLQDDGPLPFYAAATNEWSPKVLPNSYDWALFPQLEVMQKWSWLYLWNRTNTIAPAIDPFFRYIVGFDPDLVLQYFLDIDLFYFDVDSHFGRRVAQIAHTFARQAQSGNYDAIGSFQDSRIFIREPSLRSMQAILVLLGALGILCATSLRPKTCLIEDPGCIASVSILLSANPTFESFISSKRSQSGNMSRDNFAGVLCRLRQPTEGVPKLEFTLQQRGADAVRPGAAKNKLRNTSEQLLMETPSTFRTKLSSISPRKCPRPREASREVNLVARYRPIALRTYSRALLSLCITGMITALAALLAASKASYGFLVATQTSQAAWSYVPTIILVLVGYGIQSLETSVTTLEKYLTLASNKQPGRNVVLTTRNVIKARLVYTNGLAFALFAAVTVSSTVYLAIKIVAAGLYRPSFSPTTSHVVLDIDITSITGFDEFYGAISGAQRYAPLYIEDTSRELQGHFNNPQAENAVEDLVTPLLLENLTNYLDADAPKDLYASKITMESFAVQTNVTCTGFPQPEFKLILDCKSNKTYNFTFDCASQVCHQNFENLLSGLSMSFIHDHTTKGSTEEYLMAAIPDSTDASLAVLLADFSNLTGPLPEIQSLCSVNETRTLNYTDLGSSFPTIRGVNCMRTMNKVNVTTTMRPAPPGVALLDQGVPSTSWFTSGYDKDSLKISSKVNPSLWPNVLLPHGGAEVVHQGPTIYPPIHSFSIFSLIALAHSNVTEEQTELLEVNNLVTATQKVYAIHSRWALVHLLSILQLQSLPGIPVDRYPQNKTMKAAASAITYQQRIVQDTGTSIALISLLGAVLVCVIFMSVAMPRKSILPTAPSSIAVQMSFVVGSALVERLREENGVTTNDSRVWDEIFGLGWWLQRSTANRGDAGYVISIPMRWGIDAGLLPDERRGLRERPTGGAAVSSESGYIPLELGDMGHFENPFDNSMDQ